MPIFCSTVKVTEDQSYCLSSCSGVIGGITIKLFGVTHPRAEVISRTYQHTRPILYTGTSLIDHVRRPDHRGDRYRRKTHISFFNPNTEYQTEMCSYFCEDLYRG